MAEEYDGGLTIPCLIGAMVFVVASVQGWGCDEDDYADNEEQALFLYDLTSPVVEFPCVDEGLVYHLPPIPPDPIVAPHRALCRPASRMATLSDFDHDVPVIDGRGQKAAEELARAATPASNVSVESEVVSHGSCESWDVVGT